jgi:TetR/AcrR family transcriptional regulator, transcriptional repressor for nem operon
MARNKAFLEEDVLERAMQVFWKKGYHATSMEDLVSGMGINRASLYDTFGDKKQLFLKVLAFYQKKSNQEISAVMASKKPSPKAQLIAFAEFLMDDSLNSAEPKGCLLANATSEMALLDPDICQFVTDNVYSFEKTFENLISEGQTAGEFKTDISPQFAATFLSNFLYGVRTVSKTQPDANKMRESLVLALSVLG